ncbi:ATPase family AAA domain-containing protein 3 [Durusdinium trenchii]|uniref:ATPase family AAA domain-containing protein 3 n=1 Tax=Durusdinium trenchii TaxID=1381693 RepID=A0ABP0LY87_9DINO
MRLAQMPWRTKPQVKLIDPKERYVFLPLLIDYATGVVELDELAPLFDELLQEAPGVQHIQGAKLDFDAVVLASGSLRGKLTGQTRYVLDFRLSLLLQTYRASSANSEHPSMSQVVRRLIKHVVIVTGALAPPEYKDMPRVAWRRFKPSALGEFIALGSTEAAGVVEASQMANLLPPALPPGIARLASSATAAASEIQGSTKVDIGGKPASLLRRLAYLYRLPGLRHRLQVAENWLRRSSRASGDISANVRLMRPPLVRETSAWTFGRDRLRLSGLVPFGQQKKEVMEKIVLEEDLSERLNWTTNSLVNAKKNGTPFRHLLLHGPPGTGKTLFARTLARQSGLDYAIMSGGDVGPLGKDAVHELNKLFQWANNSRKGLILFIDEADAFLRTGRGSDTSAMSEEARNTLSAFLHHTGTESDKFVVVLATNIREILDKAVLDRIDESFEFPLPSLKERQRMLSMFMEEHIHKPTKRGKVIQVDDVLKDDAWLEQDGFKEGQTNEIQLPTITGKLLEKVIEYLYFKYKYTDAKVPIPEFPIDDDVVLDLLLVANYLNLY